MKRRKSKPGPNRATRELMSAVRELAEVARTGDFSKLTICEVEIPTPTQYRPRDIRALRASLGVSQGVFAMLLGVSPELVRHWEHGIRKPAPSVGSPDETELSVERSANRDSSLLDGYATRRRPTPRSRRT